jgi:hypothetical protein
MGGTLGTAIAHTRVRPTGFSGSRPGVEFPATPPRPLCEQRRAMRMRSSPHFDPNSEVHPYVRHVASLRPKRLHRGPNLRRLRDC